MWREIKAIDLLAVSPEGTVYLIEAKNDRTHKRTKAILIDDEMCDKVFSTLAALQPTQINANDEDEPRLATALRGNALKVALHLEQPTGQSKLFPRVNPANIQQKLRQLLKSIDVHPWATERTQMQGLPWKVGYNPRPITGSADGKGPARRD